MDWTVTVQSSSTRFRLAGAVQGNLESVAMLPVGAALMKALTRYWKTYGDGPLIFISGHGHYTSGDPEKCDPVE